MRQLMLLAFVIVAVLPATAARRLTVEQLEQSLAAEQRTHRPDEVIARQLAGLELSERLTDNTLNHFAARFALGPRTALALQLLADQSAFLDPPAAEFPATALPDAAAQQRMLDSARAYAVETWSRLPNFFVTRSTNRFDDTAQILHAGEWPVRIGLHLAGSSAQQVTFRDGKEVQDPTVNAASSATSNVPELGLRSWGEFGPALAIVLADMAKHTVTFSHWEEVGTTLAAVYRYEVPREASHYAVSYSYVTEHVLGRTQFGYGGQARSPQQVASIPRTKEVQRYSETPAYHGVIAIDPANGAVLRITIEAQLSGGDPLLRAATMIEYRPVAIGDRQFICPLRSLALSVEPGNMSGCGATNAMTINGVGDLTAWQGPVRCENTPVRLINETTFAGYHRLGSTMRIVNGTASSAAPNPEAPASAAQSTSAANPVPPTGALSSSASQPVSQQPESQITTAATPQLLSAPTEPVIPEVSLTAVSALPDTPANAPDPSQPGYSIKVTSRLVDVGIIATDKTGHPIFNLKATDFEVWDNGQKQEIHSFTEYATPRADQPETAPSAPSATVHAFTNRAAPEQTLGAPSADSGSTILLIDEGHIAWGDLTHARQEILKFLSSLAPGERIGLYAITRAGFRVLTEITSNHATLTAQLKNWTPASQSVLQAQDEEMRNRQQFDYVHSFADLNAVNGNQLDVPESASATDPQLRSMGSNPARDSLTQLVGVARHLSSIPGHKSVVWISSDNVFAAWENQAVGIEKGPTVIDPFILHAQEAMNEAHVAVYPFDVSQLEGGAISADLRNRNVELTQSAADTASLTRSPTSDQSQGGRNMNPGRVTAQMQQDIHPIQGPIREVAAATGGRVIRRSADLAGELKGIVDDGHATYMLSFSPPGPADGRYHTITVKLNGRRGATLRYRTGYLFEKEPATLKERFRQAVWHPEDSNEIAVAADIIPDATGADVKVNISVADLGLQQQGGRWLDKLDIFFIQRDDEGRHAQVEGQTLGLRLKSSTYQRLMPAGVPFEHFVQMHQDMASLRVLVVDENSGRMGSITIPAHAMKADRP